MTGVGEPDIYGLTRIEDLRFSEVTRDSVGVDSTGTVETGTITGVGDPWSKGRKHYGLQPVEKKKSRTETGEVLIVTKTTIVTVLGTVKRYLKFS